MKAPFPLMWTISHHLMGIIALNRGKEYRNLTVYKSSNFSFDTIVNSYYAWK